MDSHHYQTAKTIQRSSSPAMRSPAGIAGPYGEFRENGTLKTILAVLLVIDALLSTFSSGVPNLLDTNQLAKLSSNASKLDKITSLADNLHIAVIIAVIVIFSAWINRSCKNGWLLDAPHMRTSPRLSVGYYFIPILSLWKPYGNMKEIRRASFGNDNTLKSTLPLWWTLWLTSSLLGLIILTLSSTTGNQEYHLMASKLELISVPINITLNYLVITLTTSITMAQSHRKDYWNK